MITTEMKFAGQTSFFYILDLKIKGVSAIIYAV